MQTPPPEENASKEEHSNTTEEPNSTTNYTNTNGHNTPIFSDDDDNKSSSEDPSAFISAPSSMSITSCEEFGSSIDDAQKKQLYRQQLRNAATAAAANNNNNPRGRFQQRISSTIDNDDTSLSSSNLSPMPHQVVQLTSSNSDIKFSERRNQIVAAARGPLMRLQSETSSANSEEFMLEAALLPPSTNDDSDDDDDVVVGRNVKESEKEVEEMSSNEVEEEEWNGSDQPTTTMKIPPLPKLDSTDSLRGMDLTSSGADTESSISNNMYNKYIENMQYSSPHHRHHPHQRASGLNQGGENVTKKSSPTTTTTTKTSSPTKFTTSTTATTTKTTSSSSFSQPETDLAKRTKRKLTHKRQRSGDLVAATIMNPGRKDWIGMNRDNLPLPETPNYDNDDGSSSLLPLPTPEEEEEDRERSSDGNGGGGGRMESPLYPGYPSPHPTSGEHNQFFSPDSSELYDFSDSTVSNSNNIQQLHQLQYLQQHQQQQSGYGVDPRVQQYHHRRQLSETSHRRHPSETSHRRHPSGNSHRRQPSGNSLYSEHSNYSGYSGQYNDGTMYDSYGYNPNNIQWYQPTNYLPPNYRDRYEDDSESSSGDGDTTTSSSYVSEDYEDASKSTQSSSSSLRSSNGEMAQQQHPFSISGHDSNKPSLDMEPPEVLIADSSESKIDRVIQKMKNALDVPLYRTKKQTEIPEDKKYPTFFCPNCKTKQRAFLSVATASEQQNSPLGYLALYFAVYMVSSLFIFGLEEGWQPLDCVYFSVITLTTAGLGDFVPTTDSAKIVCACFIYVGVATIGLLLGSLLAGSLDDATKKDAYNAQVKDCPNCQRLERLKARPMSSNQSPMDFSSFYTNNTANSGYEEVGEPAEQSSGSDDSFPNGGFDMPKFETTQTPAPKRASHTRHMSLMVGASPRSQQQKQILSTVLPTNSAIKRNSHTRHMSLGASLTNPNAIGAPDGLDKIDESTPLIELKRSEYSKHSTNDKTTRSSEVKFCDESSYSTSSTDSSVLHHHPSKPLTRLKAAKYIFLTLNQALANSVFVIAAGSIGFYYIEEMSAVDAFYFTTVLLTSVGYGDIVPVTAAGKIFTTVFIIVAGTILLHNMTLISMIPLELRKRRIEHAVLGQFGDQLTDDELRELSTGTLVNRLKLATNRPDGLDECTREMFSLAMLVRLGRVTEEDVQATFAAFRRLDVGNYGRLNSRTIIEGELMKRRAMSSKNLVAMSKEESEWDDGASPSNYSHDSYSQGGYSPQIPTPHFEFMDYSQQGPMPMLYAPTNYAPGPEMYGATPRSQFSVAASPRTQYSEASHFNYDEYEQWASNWDHYDTVQEVRSYRSH